MQPFTSFIFLIKNHRGKNDWPITPNFNEFPFQVLSKNASFSIFFCAFSQLLEWRRSFPSTDVGQEPKGLSKAASSVKTAVQTLSHLSDTSLANVLIEDGRLVFFLKTGSLTEGFRMEMMVLGVACFFFQHGKKKVRYFWSNTNISSDICEPLVTQCASCFNAGFNDSFGRRP